MEEAHVGAREAPPPPSPPTVVVQMKRDIDYGFSVRGVGARPLEVTGLIMTDLGFSSGGVHKASATRSGLLPGDNIVECNGTSLVGMPPSAAVKFLQETEEITLVVQRPAPQAAPENVAAAGTAAGGAVGTGVGGGAGSGVGEDPHVAGSLADDSSDHVQPMATTAASASDQDVPVAREAEQQVHAVGDTDTRKDTRVAEEQGAAAAPAASRLVFDEDNMSFFSATGDKNGGYLNQDCGTAFVVKRAGKSDVRVLAVFDGHGLLGERAAQGATERLKEVCSDPAFDAEAFVRDWKSADVAMKGLFLQLHERVLEEHERVPETYCSPRRGDFDLMPHERFGKAYVQRSGRVNPMAVEFGTTAVVAVVCNGRACIGNAGDAGAIRFRRNEFVNNKAVTRHDSVYTLTQIHTAKQHNEISRIESEFAHVARITHDGYLSPLGDCNCDVEVQTTRSLGHPVLSRAGVTHEPAVLLVTGMVDTHSLILFSDGISDVMSESRICAQADKARDSQHPARDMCYAARYARDISDDCTVAILYFDINL